MPRRPGASLWISVLAIIAIGSVLGVIVVGSWGRPAPLATPAAPGTASAIVASASSAAAPTSSASPLLPSRSPSPQPSPTSTPSTPRPTSTPAAIRHVWWIVMENHEYGSIIGNRAAPYLNALAARYGLATRYYATGHPSEPNYVALVAGSTLGISTDGVYHLKRPNLFSQLAHAGRTWRVFAQDDRTGCFTGTSARGGHDGPGAAGTYARKHNPAISFTSVANNPAQCRNIVPLRAFDPDAADFEMVIPNLTNDMHDGSIQQGDSFIRALVPKITASAAFRAGGVLFITFDEGSSRAGSLGDRGGHVATFIISSGVARAFRYRTYADHYSLLRTTERLLRLPCLGTACRRSPMIR